MKLLSNLRAAAALLFELLYLHVCLFQARLKIISLLRKTRHLSLQNRDLVFRLSQPFTQHRRRSVLGNQPFHPLKRV